MLFTDDERQQQTAKWVILSSLACLIPCIKTKYLQTPGSRLWKTSFPWQTQMSTCSWIDAKMFIFLLTFSRSSLLFATMPESESKELDTCELVEFPKLYNKEDYWKKKKKKHHNIVCVWLLCGTRVHRKGFVKSCQVLFGNLFLLFKLENVQADVKQAAFSNR